MKTKNIKQWVDVNATAHEIYEIFMDSKKHGELIGASAEIDATVGGEFKIWDGTISGKTLELVPDEKIVQEWRSDEEGWPEDHFSKITLKFKKVKDGTRLLFWHSGIPETSVDSVEKGWKEYYWEPLKKMFAK